ncbi:prolipoprotein diacylglyceryl transferase [Blattabacterium cuenoti]|uniref:prolipoprotein diacylglyceryl transferase n=1 Tax=Blattabacterium cuenoti TaxID=1653831 RepID=UPI00163D2E6F|nr:prolipoprotein diacylglyceryl transferase [Blattabacterium cuenoti]
MLSYIVINWNPIQKLKLWDGFYVHIYSLMFIISFLIGWYIMLFFFSKDKIDKNCLYTLFRYTFFGTILGARLGQIFFYDFTYFSDHWIEAILPIKENKNYYLLGFIKGYEFVGYRGLSSHGATIGILLSNLIYSKNKKISFFWLCDRLSIAIAIASVLIRLGNFFNSEVIGIPCDPTLPWAVNFIKISSEYGDIIPRHPTQIYESISYLIIFLSLIFLYKKKKNYKGYLFGVFFILVWGTRFLLEFVKEPQYNEFIHISFFNTGQLLSIPFIIFGFFIFYLSNKKKTIINNENNK